MPVETILFALIPLLFLVLIFSTYHLHNSESVRTKNIESNLVQLNQTMKTLTEKLEKA